VELVRAGVNPRLAINGVLLTMYDDRTNLSRDVANEAKNFFEEKVYRTIVPRNVRLAEAPSYGMPIFQWDIACRGAKAYLAVAQEFLQRAA
ncbi:MAG: ParA family protein, partial [Acidobacteria bacterium]|nr:ParA family protein [Acidobacteriota bacterium]